MLKLTIDGLFLDISPNLGLVVAIVAYYCSDRFHKSHQHTVGALPFCLGSREPVELPIGDGTHGVRLIEALNLLIRYAECRSPFVWLFKAIVVV